MEYKEKGELKIITGCMFSGKTEELIRQLNIFRHNNKKTILFKPNTDNRYGESYISLEDGRKIQANAIETDNPHQILDKIKDEEVIGIDQANFFTEDLVNICNTLLDKNKTIIVTGIDQTFTGEPFSPIPELMALADDTKILTSICEKCGAKATKNQRLVDGEPAHKNEPLIKLNSEEHYEARCRNCHTVKE